MYGFTLASAAATVAAADVAAVGDAVGEEAERPRVAAEHPGDAERGDLRLDRADVGRELPLLDGDRDQLVREGRAPAGGRERVEQAEAVLAARDADGDAVARAEHREAA